MYTLEGVSSVANFCGFVVCDCGIPWTFLIPLFSLLLM